jgi:glycopeptide antibiotics resistance protein
MKKNPSAGVWLIFLLYCAIMCWLLFFQRNRQMYASYNLVPFKTIMLYIRLFEDGLSGSETAFINLASNIVLFTPLGFFLPRLFGRQRRYWRFFLTVTVVIIGVELLQYFFRLGSCDIDDLILNVFGSTLGFCTFSLRRREYHKSG